MLTLSKGLPLDTQGKPLDNIQGNFKYSFIIITFTFESKKLLYSSINFK